MIQIVKHKFSRRKLVKIICNEWRTGDYKGEPPLGGYLFYDILLVSDDMIFFKPKFHDDGVMIGGNQLSEMCMKSIGLKDEYIWKSIVKFIPFSSKQIMCLEVWA